MIGNHLGHPLGNLPKDPRPALPGVEILRPPGRHPVARGEEPVLVAAFDEGRRIVHARVAFALALEDLLWAFGSIVRCNRRGEEASGHKGQIAHGILLQGIGIIDSLPRTGLSLDQVYFIVANCKSISVFGNTNLR
jgi:hypothetical protein